MSDSTPTAPASAPGAPEQEAPGSSASPEAAPPTPPGTAGAGPPQGLLPRPRLQPPRDVLQACALLVLAALALLPAVHRLWALLDAGAPGLTTQMWTVLVCSALLAVAFPAVAALLYLGMPRARVYGAAAGALALAVAAYALLLPARTASTELLLALLPGVVLVFAVNIGLWSTSVRHWDRRTR